MSAIRLSDSAHDLPTLRAGPERAACASDAIGFAEPMAAARKNSTPMEEEGRVRLEYFQDSCGDRCRTVDLWGFCGAPGRTQMNWPSHRPDSRRHVGRLGTR